MTNNTNPENNSLSHIKADAEKALAEFERKRDEANREYHERNREVRREVSTELERLLEEQKEAINRELRDRQENPAKYMRGLLCDKQIRILAEKGMITPYVSSKQREIDGVKALSYGQGQHTYDLRLSNEACFILPNIENTYRIGYPHLDVKKFDPDLLESLYCHKDKLGEYFLLPPFTYALGVSVETFNLPPNIFGTCYTKSTMARAGMIITCTPLEGSWIGRLTLEFYNAVGCYTKIYCNEGLVAIRFDATEMPEQLYSGKYQGQSGLKFSEV